MKDKEYFHKLTENAVLWALFGLLVLALLVMVGFPLALALLVDWTWLFLYLLYPIALVLYLCFSAQSKELDKYEDY